MATRTYTIVESDIEMGCAELGFMPKGNLDADDLDPEYRNWVEKRGHKVMSYTRAGQITVEVSETKQPRKRIAWADGIWSCTNINNGRAYLPSFTAEIGETAWDILLDQSGEFGDAPSVVLSPDDDDPDPANKDIEVVCREWTVENVFNRVALLANHLGAKPIPSAASIRRMFEICGW